MTTDDARTGLIYLVMGDSVGEMREVPYEAERVLQDLIAQHPQILAGDQVDLNEPRRWVLLAQEAGVPGESDGYDRWSVDHLIVDQDGIPTIVEVKRSTDTRIRREVVGQMLDYAANATAYWSVDRLRSWFEDRADADGSDPSVILSEALGIEDAEAFWDQVQRNFEGGVFRLVFVADAIPPELRRVIEYMDDQMSRTRVVGIEVRRYRSVNDGSIAVLVPRVVAQSARRQVRAGDPGMKRNWDESSFMEGLGLRHPEAVPAAQAMVDWAKSRSLRLWFGSGAQTGSIYVVLDRPTGGAYSIVSLWTSGSIAVEFRSLAGTGSPFESRERRAEVVSQLNAIDGVSMPADRIDKSSGSMRMAVFTDPERRERLIAILNGIVDALHHTGQDRH